MCLAAPYQTFTGSSHTCWHKPFCSHIEELIWLKNILFFPLSLSCHLLPFPGLMYHLVIQALEARESEWPWSLLIPAFFPQPAMPAAGVD